MIIYFADRKMRIKGNASTGLPRGFAVSADKKTEDIDSGVASFECSLSFEKDEQVKLQEMVEAGNYILRKHLEENEFYTIIDSEIDVENQEAYIYAEDAGLDLLNEIALPYEATEEHPIEWYINKWSEDSGFEMKINEIPSLTRKLSWDSESTVTERFSDVAHSFDDAQIKYSFDIDGMDIVHKYINIYKSRGKDIGEELRINKNLNNIKIKSSVANLATGLYVTGGTPQEEDDPITLNGYKYDDGDIYIDGVYLKSRSALSKWSRYLSESGTGEGHIIRTYSFDTVDKQELCDHAIKELKSICDAEVNYEVDIAELAQSVEIGDRVNLIDDNGKIYLSARVLKLESSIAEDTYTATLGEYLIKNSGISEQVEALASQFAEIAKNRNFYTWIVYADDENGNGITLDQTGKPYMGISVNRSGAEPDLTDPSLYKWSKIQGQKGDIGISITDITENYLVSPLSSGIAIDTEGWSTSIPMMTPVNRYLWNYEVFTYSDKSTQALEPKIIGIYGDTGQAGDPAPAIVSMTEQYYMSISSAEQAGGQWQNTMPQWESGKYLWTRWRIEWDKANPELLTYSEPIIASGINDIYETANDAKEIADEAKSSYERVITQVGQFDSELSQANQELDALTEDLQTLESTMITNYATKGELTKAETDLATQIEQNAAQISQTVTKVQAVEVDAAKALQDAADAATAAAHAQQNATDAQNKYTQLKLQADVTDEQIATAEEAVQQAQADALAAGNAAAAAAAAASALADRVTTAESNITQNAEQIGQTVTKVNSLKFGGRNLILESDIMEESGEYGFGERELSLALKPNMEYTLSANGRVNGGDAEYYLLVKVETEDGLWSAQTQILGEDDNTQSVTFTTPEWVDDTEAKVKCYFAPENTGSVGTCTVNWVKLEEGNKPTDWTPAPEDINVQLSESLEVATSEILQTAESITMRIVSGYTSSDDFEEYKQQVENLFEASENGFEFQFNQLQQNINDVSQEIVGRNQFIRFEEGNIIIGKSDSPIQAKFTNDSLEFLYNDQTVAKFTNEVLEVHNVSVENQIRFGSDWAIRPGSAITGKGNNLNVVWIGG